MTMTAKPTTTYDGTLRSVAPFDGGVFVECELVEPRSNRGRKVYLLLDLEMETKLLLELRRLAIERRRTTLSEAEI